MQVKDVTDEMVLKYFDEKYEAMPVLDMMQTDGIPFKVALRKLEQMVERGIIEYGTSLNYVWLK